MPVHSAGSVQATETFPEHFSEAVVVRGEPERVNVSIGQKQMIVDRPGVRMVPTDLDEVETICRIDAGTRCDETLLEFGIFT